MLCLQTELQLRRRAMSIFIMPQATQGFMLQQQHLKNLPTMYSTLRLTRDVLLTA